MFELTTCVMVNRQGKDCFGPLPEWSPLPLCEKHLRAAYLVFAEHLEDMPGPTRQDIEDAMKMHLKPTPHVEDEDPVVYYIRIGDLIKIGTTRSFANRMGCLVPDEILAREIGSYDLERERHRQFRDSSASRGREYFHPTAALMTHIAEVRRRWMDRPAQPVSVAGLQPGMACPQCDLKTMHRQQAYGPARCLNCGYETAAQGE